MSNQTNPEIQMIVDEAKIKFERRIEEIRQEGSERVNDIRDDSPDPNSVEATINMTFDVKFKTTTIKFDIPKFSKELQKIVFDVPTVKMDTKTISWDEPATRMVQTCVAKKPVTTCRGGGVRVRNGIPQVTAPTCTIEWVCVYMDMPEVYMKRREIKIDMPEFSMKKQEISFDKPIIKFDTIEIKIDLPQFHLRDLSGDLRTQEDKLEDVGEDMEHDIHEATEEMNISLLKDISNEVNVIFGDIRTQLLTERQNVCTYYDDAVSKMKAAIKLLKENNATDEVGRLEADLSKLVDDYKKVLSDIDNSLRDIDKQQEEVINQIKIQ